MSEADVTEDVQMTNDACNYCYKDIPPQIFGDSHFGFCSDYCRKYYDIYGRSKGGNVTVTLFCEHTTYFDGEELVRPSLTDDNGRHDPPMVAALEFEADFAPHLSEVASAVFDTCVTINDKLFDARLLAVAFRNGYLPYRVLSEAACLELLIQPAEQEEEDESV